MFMGIVFINFGNGTMKSTWSGMHFVDIPIAAAPMTRIVFELS